MWFVCNIIIDKKYIFVTALKCLFIEFLLQVFDKTEKQIRIYDNTGHHMNISPPDMDILK